jgi:uncharacterized protein with FMN-binding domain
VPKRGAFALALTAAALVLLLNFQAPSDVATLEPATRSGTTTTSGTSSGTDVGATTSSQATPAPVTGSGTVSGSTVNTRYGPVQVSVTIENGKLTAVTALQLPSGGRSGEISNEVGPILSSQALSAQSANIDGVSGATFTSSAYAKSLQAALDAAGFNG